MELYVPGIFTQIQGLLISWNMTRNIIIYKLDTDTFMNDWYIDVLISKIRAQTGVKLIKQTNNHIRILRDPLMRIIMT